VEKRIINPWEWQNRLGFSQGIEITNGERVLYCAGQASTDEEGRPVHKGDMRAQIRQALDNLEVVLKGAGFGLSDVVRLNYFTTDVEGFFKEYEAALKRLAEAGCQPASKPLGARRLAFKELLIEMEATAVK
jgi:enamine deaminase RidA (YjgF/YER057c/UK114 family)